MTHDQREIHRKKRVLEYAEPRSGAFKIDFHRSDRHAEAARAVPEPLTLMCARFDRDPHGATGAPRGGVTFPDLDPVAGSHYEKRSLVRAHGWIGESGRGSRGIENEVNGRCIDRRCITIKEDNESC